MKRFFVMILCVSTFFIGLGGIADRVGAEIQSDARALELIKQARIAIGGDANISNINSMTIVGKTTRAFESDGLQQTRQGEMEINMQLPGQFSKMLTFGDPDAAAPGEHIEKSVEMVFVGGDDVKMAGDHPGGENVVVIRRDGAASATTPDGSQVREGRRIIVTTPDGTTEDIRGPENQRVVVESEETGGANVWNTDDDREIVIKSDDDSPNGPHFRGNEMLRLTVGLILTADPGTSYKYLGEGQVDGNPSNIIGVSSNGSEFKLFLDKSTNLPRMISFQGMDPVDMIRTRTRRASGQDAPQEREVRIISGHGEPIERQMKFSDFRSVSGVLLPHRWTETAGGNPDQTFEVTRFEINPANISEKFTNQQIRVIQEKPQN